MIAAYQAQLAAESAGDEAQQPPAKGSSRQGGGADRAAGAAGSRLATPRQGGRSSACVSGDAAALQLPANVKLPEHGGFVAYFVDAGG